MVSPTPWKGAPASPQHVAISAQPRVFSARPRWREVIDRRQPPDHFDLAAADAVADGAAWQADWAEGRMLPVEQAIVDALAQTEEPSAAGSFPVPGVAQLIEQVEAVRQAQNYR